MTRGSRSQYVRLGSDQVVFDALAASDWNHTRAAARLSADSGQNVLPQSVSTRVRAMRSRGWLVPKGVTNPWRDRPDAELASTRDRRALLELVARRDERILALEAEVALLERVLAEKPRIRIVEFKPNHRRRKDGGINVNEQRRRLREELGA